jgi:hypothetical protein
MIGWNFRPRSLQDIKTLYGASAQNHKALSCNQVNPLISESKLVWIWYESSPYSANKPDRRSKYAIATGHNVNLPE